VVAKLGCFMSYSLRSSCRNEWMGRLRITPPLLGDMSYGIEVTEPGLAVRCQLGNLDPQHGPDGSGEAAIAAAITSPLPPKGARLVIIRPDMDAPGGDGDPRIEGKSGRAEHSNNRTRGLSCTSGLFQLRTLARPQAIVGDEKRMVGIRERTAGSCPSQC
jgi:hypothetical protein